MSITRRPLSTALLAAPCLLATLIAHPAQAQTAVPDYFFSEWTVASNCTEQHVGLAASVASGLKFQISRNSLAADGSYTFVAEDAGQQHWAVNWNGLRLQYRPGTQMAEVPADFECVPGQESSSPFLAMSGFTQATEPYYEQEHWYGLATIQGQLEHVLIFPRNMQGQSSSIIVLQSASSANTVKLDDNGVIHDDN